MFAKPGHHLLPPERIDEWRRDRLDAVLPLRLRRGAAARLRVLRGPLRYDPFEAAFAQPTIVFQGMRDASVDYRTVEQFAPRAAERDALAAGRRSSADSQPAANLGRHVQFPGTRMTANHAATEARRTPRLRWFVLCALCVSVASSSRRRRRGAGCRSARFASASSGRAAATRCRRSRSKRTSPACWRVRRRATAGRPRSRRWRSRSGPMRSRTPGATTPTVSTSATRRIAR